MPADTQLLAAVPLFERFNDEERELLASQLDEVEFQAGQMIFRRTDPGGAIFIPFAYVEAAANILTNPQLDPIGKIPEYKFCAARVGKAVVAEAAE